MGLTRKKSLYKRSEVKDNKKVENGHLKIWDEIMETECQALIETMPYRIFLVILLKGAKTKY